MIDAPKRLVDAYFADRGLLPGGCDDQNKMFAEKRWIVYLDSELAIESAIAYVTANPVRHGRPAQDRPFVVRFTRLAASLVAYHDLNTPNFTAEDESTTHDLARP